ncbi:flagellar hook-length control protein FliK [Pseudooceanicola nanhaiensis]|uniref:flagellar hook-length control protein FliK n=1 Tax=Pseudooceanicola nanhaiensis TaxID=375761 RepID=UPI0035160B42
MIDLMALFTGPAAGATPGAQPGAAGQGGGLFAALMAALKPEAAGEAALPEGLAGLVQKLASVLEGAETALAVPDLSDAEITDILDRLVTDLAGLLSAQPQVAAQLTSALALLVDRAADPAIAAEMPPRLLAEALPALRAAIAGPGPVLPEAAEEAPGLAPLLTRIAVAVEARQDAGRTPPPAFAAQTTPPKITAAPAGTAQAAVQAPAVAPLPVAGDLPAAELPPLPPAGAAPPAPAGGPAAQAPAAPPLPVEPREVLAQVRAQVGDQGRIRVELRPEGLGAVEIDLGPDEAGQLRVVVRAENAAVLAALRGDRDGLLMLLRGAGHDVQDGAMSFGDFGPGRDGRPRAAGTGWMPVQTGEAAAEDEAPPAPVLIAGGVDMTV